ncbi:MAG: hypothetical protein RL662_1996 [Bacteroidota bacterium]|jgi:putative phosphoesterase
MKKIGLLSDTHGYWDEKYKLHFANCDEIWHAGDIGSTELAEKLEAFKPLRAVYGNIDGGELRKTYSEFMRFTTEGVDVLMTHIGGYPNKYIPKVKHILETNPPTLFICGHSHILKVMFDKRYNCLDINPGAAGKSGFHKVRTLIRFVLEKGIIRDLEIIELH